MRQKAWVKKFVKHYSELSCRPCSEAVEYLNKHRSFQEAWDKCERPDWMHWLAFYANTPEARSSGIRQINDLHNSLGGFVFGRRTGRVTLCKVFRMLCPKVPVRGMS